MSEVTNFENKLLYYWLKNLVGTNTSFSFNLFINLSAGLIYTFKIIPSPYLLLIFGVISPLLFTLCLYFFIRNGSVDLLDEPLPKVFLSRASNHLLMALDICLIIGFALLIYLGPLNYFAFRFLQTIFFPGMMLVFLRILYVSKMIHNHSNKKDEMNL